MKTVTLVERRSVVRRLPRRDVDDLLRHFRHVVEVTPAFARGAYRLAARGYVGAFGTASIRWEVRPKLPWAGLRWLTSRSAGAVDELPDAHWDAALADLLAGRLADLIRERTATGLLRDYVERSGTGATVRGRIDFAGQLRDLAGAPGRFHLIADEFTADNVWNRLPKAAAGRLLDVPGLPTSTRERLAAAVAPLASVSTFAPTDEDFARLRFDARTEPYRPLVRFCRLVLGAHPGPPGDGSAFLLNLEHLFQIHVGDLLARPGALPPGWSVEAQSPLPLTPDRPAFDSLTLRPDLVARGPDGVPRSVWDVKWKSLRAAGPDAADAHQVLGYAAALGLRRAGLVYPGRKFTAAVYRPPESPVELHVVRLRLLGPPDRLARAAARLGHLVGTD